MAQAHAGSGRTEADIACFGKTQQIHLVGIGGSGMSGIAEVLLTLGTRSPVPIFRPPRRPGRWKNWRPRFSSAIRNPMSGGSGRRDFLSRSPQQSGSDGGQSQADSGIPRAEMLAELMRLKFGVAIAGRTAKPPRPRWWRMCLRRAGLDPTMVIGGKVNALGSHARLGGETSWWPRPTKAMARFSGLSPTIVAVTNLDREHLDHLRHDGTYS